MKERMMKFMQGRYGVDKRGQFEMILAIAFFAVSVFLHMGMFYGIALLILIDMYVRMFSKDIEYRYAQNAKFMKYYNRFAGLFSRNKARATAKVQRDPNFKIYKCPDCRQKVRVPKGRGKVEIRCPKCQKTFVKKS